ncbi:uncharacterized protein KY384_004063 [Bacidia gigantensis]|uniref:uncharacterized protein n=1 Tax=Bacidia gigantensis TaxID=2732470 RepID=UPI001D03C2AF|nr:uncharacterized protein KY384_004063 [Bacidia gigantensis]KAG8530707.1 hypothetical protein KY384_004063 [Bacidia gigantensis]
MFGGVDVYWALCMALNVYLALFHGWTTKRMQSVEWRYLTACYGLSLIPAIVYLFVRNEERGRVYGPAVLWCWIDADWSILRILTLYLIVWLALLGALVIYCFALVKAWRNRRVLKPLLNPLNEDPFAGIVTTDIEVVFSEGESETGEARPAPRTRFSSLNMQEVKNSPYTVTVQGIRSDRKSSRPELLRLPSWTRNAALAEENAEAWLYARAAFLYFLAMVICWIPASVYRLNSLINPDSNVFGLSEAAIIGLPLQGFLNALVYYVSSQTATKRIFSRASALKGSSRVGSTRDAQRIRDSYPPSGNEGGATFQAPHYGEARSEGSPSQPSRFYSGANTPRKGTAMASLDSFNSSARTSTHMV